MFKKQINGKTWLESSIMFIFLRIVDYSLALILVSAISLKWCIGENLNKAEQNLKLLQVLFQFAFNREQASFLSKNIFQSRACKILDVYCYRQWLQWTKWKNNNTAAVYYAILWIYYYLRHWNNNSSQRCSHVSIQSGYIV